MAQAEAVGGPSRALLLAVAAGLGSQAIVSTIALTPPVLAPVAAPAFGLAPSDVGLFTMLVFLTAVVSAAAGGSLIARLGAVRTTQLATASAAIGILLLVTAEPLLGALGAMLVGVGYGPMTPASSHMLAALTTARNRPLYFSLKQTSIPLGGALAGLVPPLVATRFGWQAAFAGMAAVGLLAAIALEPIRARFDADRDPAAPLAVHVLRPVREVLAHPALRQIVVVSFTFAAVQACFSAFFVTFLVERAEVPLVTAGLILMLGQVLAIGGRILWGALAERVIPTRRLLVLLGLVMAACSLASVLVTADWPTLALAVLSAVFGLSAVGWNGLYLSEIVRVTSAAESGRATGGTLAFTFGGMMAVPPVFSLIVGLTGGYGVAFAALAAVAMVAVVALLRWRA